MGAAYRRHTSPHILVKHVSKLKFRVFGSILDALHLVVTFDNKYYVFVL